MQLIRNLVLAAVATGLGLSAADPALLKLVPQDAAFIAGIHADQIKTSRFGQFLLDQLKTEEDKLEKLITVTGFDPRRDLTEVVVASSDTRGRGGKTLVIAKGRFDPARVSSFLASEGGAKLAYQGIDIIGKNSGTSGGLAFLDATTALAGDLDFLKAAIDRSRQGSSAMDPAMANRITELSTRYDAWIFSSSVDRVADDLRDSRLKGAMNGALMQSMQSVAGGVRFGASVELMAEGVMRSEKDATAMVDVVRFLASMLQLNRDKDEKAADLAELLEKAEVKANGNQFRMLLNVPEDLLERVMKPATLRRKRPAGVI
ncbi:MAG: hypothetical protein SFV51_01495 [Bryobacteraceae bacterium]|nr:hypothetical protein [Bryobacteraceae bacterium]